MSLSPRHSLAAIVLLAASPLFAQPKEEPLKPVTRAAATARLDADFAGLDGNKDGKVTQAEIAAHLSAKAKAEQAAIEKRRDERFTQMDANKDGSISRAEYSTANRVEVSPSGDGSKILGMFDANKDGSFTLEEYRAPSLANFNKLDANRDGTLSVAEQTPKKTATQGR